ncbi:MAG: cobyric acid synthase [Deltaproteobacteria bacterium]|nr:cobyric acid synthase [Deltaproteobacteria bacterium]
MSRHSGHESNLRAAKGEYNIMAKKIMFLGTGSDVGKSVAVTAFCRIFKRRGFKVTPFKAQNMSNNSYITIEGGEIGRAQAVQAEAAKVLPSVHMNPVLLKPSSMLGSQIVLQGSVFGNMNAKAYEAFKPRLRAAVMESFGQLEREYDLIVMEGAGSCCEMNLKENDIVNLSMAEAVNAPCVLVADIDRGGVFAQIIGTYNLMSRKERGIIAGFLINKFRGDPALFASGIEYIEKKTGKPVLGLVPWFNDIRIDQEDSVAIQDDRRIIRPAGRSTVNIAVVRLPCVSNFTDMEALSGERDVVLNYLIRPSELSEDYDCLIIPGTKNVMEDAAWISRTGWKRAVRHFAEKGTVVGICGGYQLMGMRISDPHGVESAEMSVKGIGLLPVETVLEREKTVRKVSGRCMPDGHRVTGYEIHMGQTYSMGAKGEPWLSISEPGEKTAWEEGCAIEDGRIAGTYVHGIFDSPSFRAGFLNILRRGKGITEKRAGAGPGSRSRRYDRLADHFEGYCDVDKISSAIGI